VLVQLDVVASPVQALVAASYVRKEGSVVSATTRAVGASSRVGVEGGIFSVERGLVQREIDVVGDPCGEVFGGEQMRFVVLPVLAPALREGLGLFLLREP